MSAETETGFAPDVVAFLEARLAEVEASAKNCAKAYPSPWDTYDRGHMAKVQAGEPNFRIVAEIDQDDVQRGMFDWLGEPMSHIGFWDPARALEMVAVYRRIIDRYKRLSEWVGVGGPSANLNHIAHMVALGEVLIDLAHLWHDHPDWHEDWECN